MQKKLRYIFFSIFIIGLVVLIINYDIFYKNYSPITWNKSSKIYDFQFRTILQSSGVSQKKLIKNMSIKAKLFFKVYEIKNDSIFSAFQFSDIVIKTSRRKNKALERIFSKIFFIEFTKEGEIKKFVFSNLLAKKDEDIIKDIVYNFQFIILNDISSSYTVVERDNNGDYKSLYSISNNKLIKKKIKYIFSKNFDNIKIIKCNSTIDYEKSKLWADALSHEELLLFSNYNHSKLKVSTSIKLNKIDVKLNSDLVIFKNDLLLNQLKNNFQIKNKNKISLLNQTRKKELKNKFQNKSFNQIVNSLFQQSKKFNVNIIRVLLEYLELYPNSAYKFLSYLKSHNLTSTQRIILVHALERDGSISSQKALIQILNRNDFKKETRLQAAIAFSTIIKPSKQSIASLWRLYQRRNNKTEESISNTVLLSLGNIVEKLDNNYSKNRYLAGVIKDKIRNELNEVKDSNNINKINAVLYAAGNTSDKMFIDDISNYIENDDQRVRTAAVSSLLNINDEKVNVIFEERLEKEENANVRNAIMQTMYKKEANEELIQTVIRRIPLEENDIVRGQMYRYLLKNRNHKDVKVLLADRLSQERLLEHKKLIQRALYTNK